MTSTPRTVRRALPALALVAVAALAAGCGPDDSGASPTASPSVTGVPSVLPSSAPPGTDTPTMPSSATPTPTATGVTGAPAPTPTPAAPTGSPGSGTGSGTAGCATRDLSVSVGAGQGAAGSTYVDLDFKNVSGRTCALYGYPGVSLAGGLPVTRIGPAATRSGASPRVLVTLTAGATAHALLRVTDAADFDAATCHPKPAHYLQVYPPNRTTPVYVSYDSAACASVGLLTVSTVLPGVGDGS